MCLLNLHTKAINYFCLAADSNKELLPLKISSGLIPLEWKQVKLVHHCLQVCNYPIISLVHLITAISKLVAKQHNKLSKEDTPTCTQLYPTLKMLMSDWEELLKNEEYKLIHDALHASIALLEKYYHCSDDTNAYFISHIKSWSS